MSIWTVSNLYLVNKFKDTCDKKDICLNDILEVLQEDDKLVVKVANESWYIGFQDDNERSWLEMTIKDT